MRNHSTTPVAPAKEVAEQPKTEDKNVFWVNDFTESEAKTFCQQVLKFSREDEHTPLLVYIDSYGGAVDSLASIISVLDLVPNKVVTVATGKAMSCGAILLSHGDIRYVAAHARVMIHEVSSGGWGNINDVKTHAEESARLNEYYMDLLASNCSKTRKELAQYFTNERRDYYMTAKDSVRFNIADAIGIPTLRKISRYELVVGSKVTRIRE